MQEVDSKCDWTTPLISYLKTGLLPNGKEAARKLKFPSITICANKRHALQKRILVTVPKVFKLRGSKLRNERSSQGYLWKPFKGIVVSAQVDPSGVLLANYAERHTSLCQDL